MDGVDGVEGAAGYEVFEKLVAVAAKLEILCVHFFLIHIFGEEEGLGITPLVADELRYFIYFRSVHEGAL